MTFTATIPIANYEAARADLEAGGWGPDNFSRPMRVGSGDVTHMGMHYYGADAAYRAAVAALPGVEITDGAAGVVTFPAHAAARSQTWEPPDTWFVTPIMTGDRRFYADTEWESLVDFNVWTPPVAWREIVATGYPAWVQPTGAHDAYPLGFRVSFNGQNWENTGSAANVWQPGVFGWVMI